MGAGLDRRPDGVEVLHQARGRRRARRPRPRGTGPSARAARSSAPRPGRRSGATSVGELLLDHGRLDRRPACRSRSPSAGRPAGPRAPTARRAGRRRAAPGTRAATAATCAAMPLGEGLRQVAARAGVDDGPVAAGALQPGGQRPRPGGLHLERAGVAAGDVVEGVEVALAGTPRARRWSTPGRGTSRQPAGRQVDGEVDQQRGAAADQVRPGARDRAARAGAANSGSSPTTSRTASAGSVPGRDPTPEAGPQR